MRDPHDFSEGVLLVSALSNCDLSRIGPKCTSKCHAPVAIKSGQIRFMNVNMLKSDIWDELGGGHSEGLFDVGHCGIDHAMLPVANMSACVVSFFVLLLCLRCQYRLVCQGQRHIIFDCVVTSCVLRCLDCCLNLSAWSLYCSGAMRNGEILPFWNLVLAGNNMRVISKGCLIVHFILIAKGWKIVRRHLSTRAKVKILSFGLLYVMAGIFAESARHDDIHDEKDLNINIVTTLSGLINIFLEVFSLFWFYEAANSTVHQFPGLKIRFYRKYRIFVGAWICIQPILWLNIAFVGWESEMVMMVGAATLSLSIGQVGAILLFWPEAQWNRGFPIHSHQQPAYDRKAEEVSAPPSSPSPASALNQQDSQVPERHTAPVTTTTHEETMLGTRKRPSTASPRLQEGSDTGRKGRGRDVSERGKERGAQTKSQRRRAKAPPHLTQEKVDAQIDDIKALFTLISRNMQGVEKLGQHMYNTVRDWGYSSASGSESDEDEKLD